MPNKLQRRIIMNALDEPEKLTEWEYGFIESLAKLDDDKVLSEKQNEILNRISQKLV